MAEDATRDQLTQQLSDVEAEIADLQRSSGQVTTSLGNDGDGVENSEDIAAELTNYEENEGVLELLQQRRDSIKAKLDAL